MLDPAISLIISIGFTLLLISAGGHKLTNRLRFRGILEGYQILPVALVPAAAIIIGLLEIILGFCWAVGWQKELVAFITAELLTMYALAIAINLIHGRSYIDCGCGFSTMAVDHSQQQTTQQLSTGLLYRNGLLIAAALSATFPATNRLLGIADYLGILFAVVTLILIYAAFNQLLVNNNAIKSWRNTDA